MNCSVVVSMVSVGYSYSLHFLSVSKNDNSRCNNQGYLGKLTLIAFVLSECTLVTVKAGNGFPLLKGAVVLFDCAT